MMRRLRLSCRHMFAILPDPHLELPSVVREHLKPARSAPLPEWPVGKDDDRGISPFLGTALRRSIIDTLQRSTKNAV